MTFSILSSQEKGKQYNSRLSSRERTATCQAATGRMGAPALPTMCVPIARWLSASRNAMASAPALALTRASLATRRRARAGSSRRLAWPRPTTARRRARARRTSMKTATRTTPSAALRPSSRRHRRLPPHRLPRRPPRRQRASTTMGAAPTGTAPGRGLRRTARSLAERAPPPRNEARRPSERCRGYLEDGRRHERNDEREGMHWIGTCTSILYASLYMQARRVAGEVELEEFSRVRVTVGVARMVR